MKILITGGLGFIGSHLEPVLIKKGHNVTIMDRIRINRPNYYRGDICDYSRMEHIFQKSKPGLVIHLAAVVSHKESEETPYMMYKGLYGVSLPVLGTLYRTHLEQITNTREFQDAHDKFGRV